MNNTFNTFIVVENEEVTARVSEHQHRVFEINKSQNSTCMNTVRTYFYIAIFTNNGA